MGFMMGPWDQERDPKREEHIILVTHGDADAGSERYKKKQVEPQTPFDFSSCIFPIRHSSKKHSSMKMIEFPGMDVSTF